jgi:hypothetical protein
MQSHVTLLYPFVDDRDLAAQVIDELRYVLAGFGAFDFVLADPGEFPVSRTTATVLFLAPEPAQPFREMTTSLVRARRSVIRSRPLSQSAVWYRRCAPHR